MNYNELARCYPEFKIPVPQHGEYYVNTLLRSGYVKERPVKLLETLECNQDVYKCKKKFMDDTLNYFKEQKWDFSKASHEDSTAGYEKYESDYQEKDFNDYKDGKVYVSIDLKSANWQSFQHYWGLSLVDWEVFLIDSGIRPHSFFAESKSIRQFIFGNTNPKKLKRVQNWMMGKLIEKFKLLNYIYLTDKIVGRKADEVIFEFDDFPSAGDLLQMNVVLDAIPFKFKMTIFETKTVTNYGDTIRVKEVMDVMQNLIDTKFMALSGNRFFIHLKTLLMNEEIDERDLLFLNDNKLAKWVL